MIRVDALQVMAGGRTLLSGVSFELASGTLLGIHGPNGSGKSTLLKCLAGSPGGLHVSGRIRFGDLDWTPRIDPQERSRWVIRLGSEFLSPFPVTVFELLELAAGRSAHHRIAGVVSKLKLEPLLSRDFGTLSDGERQWVMLARGWIQAPRALLFDETFSKLDLDRLSRLAVLLPEMAREGIAVGVVSHDLNLIARLSDRVLLLKEGRMLALGSVDAALSEASLDTLYPGAGIRLESRKPFRIGF
jgi:iron complex transport system ATP-binding protein